MTNSTCYFTNSCCSYVNNGGHNVTHPLQGTFFSNSSLKANEDKSVTIAQANTSQSGAIYLHTWVKGNTEVHLVRIENEIGYHSLNRLTRKEVKKCLDGNQDDSEKKPSLEERASHFIKCEPWVNHDGTVRFLNYPLSWSKSIYLSEWNWVQFSIMRFSFWLPCGHKKIQGEIQVLSGENNRLILQIFDKNLNETLQFPLSNSKCRLVDRRVERETHQEDAPDLQNRLRKDDITLFKDYTLKYLEEVSQNADWTEPKPPKIFPEYSLIFTPSLIFRSRINGYTEITRFGWAVTLLRAGGTSCLGNHAEIIMEGMNEKSEYFMYLAHLTQENGGNVKFEDDWATKNLSWIQRTQVWKVPKYKVENMIASIKADVKHPPVLSRWGSDSIFSNQGEESCFTWARKKMKEDLHIDLGTSSIGWLVTITSNYTTI